MASFLRSIPMRYLIMVLFLISSGCYSFKGISIPAGINSFYVTDFENRASNAPATIDQVFSEALRAKVRNESRLQLVEQSPDITFQGSISGFRITSEAPQEGNTVAFNKLTITVAVEYVDSKNEDNNWKKTFSFFRDFDSTIDFQASQDGFIDEIFVQITEDIFNRAFTDW